MKHDRPTDHDSPSPLERPLAADLARTLERVGPDGYARATARDFATGGKYNPRDKRPRFART